MKQIQALKQDKLKWTLASFFLFVWLVLDIGFPLHSLLLRFGVWCFILLVLGWMIFRTSQMTQLIAFSKQSRDEIKKIVWPTRQETIQTTLSVVVMVSVVSGVLWLVDTFFFWLVASLTGY